jgi:hypothetical protein
MKRTNIALCVSVALVVASVTGCSKKGEENIDSIAEANALRRSMNDSLEKKEIKFSYSLESMTDCGGFFKLMREIQQSKGNTQDEVISMIFVGALTEASNIVAKENKKTDGEVLEIIDASYSRYHSLLVSGGDKNIIRETLEEAQRTCEKIPMEDEGVKSIAMRLRDEFKKKYKLE